METELPIQYPKPTSRRKLNDKNDKDMILQ